MTKSGQTNPEQSSLRQRLSDIYALLTGVFGVVVLTKLLEYQTTSFDLLTLLPFTLLTLLASYFYVPIKDARLSLDNATLLAAMLTGGPITGSWAGFIGGMVTSFVRRADKQTAPTPWLDNLTAAALNGGCNVIATGTAWVAYYWLGGTLSPGTLTPSLALALVLLSLVYVLVRNIWTWPALLLKSSNPSETLKQIASPHLFLIDLLPLPLALVLSPSFLPLGWLRTLILALAFIGWGALIKQILEQSQVQENKIQVLAFTARVKQAIADAPPNAQTLCKIAGQFCAQVTSEKCELGLYDAGMSHVHIHVSLEQETSLPPMHIPITPLWKWAADRQVSTLLDSPSQLNELPFNLGPLAAQATPQALLCVPIFAAHIAPDDILPDAPPSLGAIILQSDSPNAFPPPIIERITILASLIGDALPKAKRHVPAALLEQSQKIARQIRRELVTVTPHAWPGWEIATAQKQGTRIGGSWYDIYPTAGNRLQIVLGDALKQGLSGALVAASGRALVHAANASSSTLAETLQQANDYLFAACPEQQTALLCATVDQEGILTWINAGQEPPIWWHHGQKRAEILKTEGEVLGQRADMPYEEKHIALAPGDTLLLCTTSLNQTQSKKGIKFEKNKIEEIFQDAVSSSATALLEKMMAQIDLVFQDPLPEQDILLVALHRQEDA